MEPLAYRLRPTSLEEMAGNEKVMRIVKKMMENNALRSIIFYGDPGVGKTTLATIIASNHSQGDFIFNASTDNKARLKDLIDGNNLFSNPVIIVDEIHCMKKDIQDYLLPFIESGKVIVIGLTTENPYHAINKALRSRMMIFKLEKLNEADIRKIIERALKTTDKTVDDEVFNYLYQLSNGEARYALNILEQGLLSEKKHLSLVDFTDILPQRPLDKDGEEYYLLLSALQKSIRGSDCNAALHYAARLAIMGDYVSLFRRLTVIAYEDIGLGNPQIGPRLEAAISAFNRVGLPEGFNILGPIIIDMALSPKSNSASMAMVNAAKDVYDGLTGPVPDHLNNDLIRFNKNLYKYPHDYPGHFVKQQYLPDNMTETIYYHPCETSNYEESLKTRYEIILKHLR